MAEYDGEPLWQFWQSYPITGVFQGERFKNRYYISTEKSYDPAGKSLIFWSGDTIEFWVEPTAGERTLELQCWANSVGKIRARIYEVGNDTPLDEAVNSLTGQWEKLSLTFTADDTKNYFLRIENLPLEQGWTKREKAYIDSLELK
jgi:hypothetical protein